MLALALGQQFARLVRNPFQAFPMWSMLSESKDWRFIETSVTNRLAVCENDPARLDRLRRDKSRGPIVRPA